MTQKGLIGLALTGLVAASVAVIATVTFDPSTGTGFVGKGDVQSAFGWNNAQLQAKAAGVTFTYSQTVDEQLTCLDGNSQVSHAEKSGTRSGTVGANVNYDARTHNQIDGFVLTGLGSAIDNLTYSNGDPSTPAFQACATNFPNNVTTVTSNNGPVGLYVSYNGASVQLPY
jgi:hypothetical protein